MKIYRFNPDTNGYIGWVDVAASEAPRYQGPGYTQDEPPDVPEGKTLVKALDGWSLVDDVRGAYHNPETGEVAILTDTSQVPDDGFVRGLPDPKPPTLKDAQDARIELMKKDREAAAADPGPITTPFGEVNGDGEALTKVQQVLAGWGAARTLEAAGMGTAPATVNWIMFDNTKLPVSYEQLSLVAVLMLQRGEQAFNKYSALRDQILAATTIEEVEAITW